MTIWQTFEGLWVTGYGLCQIVAVVFEAAGIGTPVAVHFDEELEEDLFLEEVLDVFAGLGTDALESGASFADEDTLLGIAFAVDDSRNLNEISIGHW